MSRELDEAMDAIPNLTEDQVKALIDFQIAELAAYNVKGTRAAKKDQSEDAVLAALKTIVDEQPKVQVAGKFKRRF